MSHNFAVIGYPLGHTMSPIIHKCLFELAGITDSSYEVMEIAPEFPSDNIQKLKSLDGFNITIPHKLAIMKHLDVLSDGAKMYGAVNVVKNDNGVHHGYNTDVDGFMRCVDSLSEGLLGKKVLLFGCGGAGRMMAIKTCSHGGDLTIAVRNAAQSSEVKRVVEDIFVNCSPKSKVRVIDIKDLDNFDTKYDLLINSTPVGMYPNADACIASDKIIANCSYVFDAVYNPTMTQLVAKARAMHGDNTAISGMAMLVWQAVVAHEIWHGYRYKGDDIIALIKEMEKLV